MKKKILMGIFLIVILIANVSFASYNTVTMTVVEEPICTIKMGENSKFEKKLISKDLANKEVTLQLQVTNEEISQKPTGELILVLDDSHSMSSPVSGNTTRKELLFEAAQNLVSNLLRDNTQLKIGIVSFSTKSVTEEATIEDANVVAPLSNDVATLTNAISNLETNGPRTNLHAGLSLASQQFSQTSTNKYMIVLTDGIPNVAINESIYFSENVFNKTKEMIQTVGNTGIKLSVMLTGIDNESFKPAPSVTQKTNIEIITEVFGTPENPTAGNFYYITDDQITTTITNTIYNSLVPIEKSLKDITIVDYFPEEIIKNFDFSYVSNPNFGIISTKVDTSNNSITWTIPELVSGQTATVQYKLKLKQNFDSTIVNKILNTNQKVDVSYTDTSDIKQQKTSDISPKLKLTEPPVVLPKAGTITFITCAILVIILFIFSFIKLSILHKEIK